MLRQHVQDYGDDEHQQHGQRYDAQQPGTTDGEEVRIKDAVGGVAIRQDKAGCDRASGRGNELKAGQEEIQRERREEVRDAKLND